MAAGTVLPADGVTIWRVTGTTGDRWLRLPKGGPPLGLPAGSGAEQVTWAGAEQLTEGAPPYLRQIWRLAESAPGWGWTLRQVHAADGGQVVGWFLSLDKPGGGQARFTWVDRGGRMHLVAQTETVAAVRRELGGP